MTGGFLNAAQGCLAGRALEVEQQDDLEGLLFVANLVSSKE